MPKISQKKRQKILIGILVLVIIIGGFMLYSNYIGGPSETLPEEEPAIPYSYTKEAFKEVRLDLSVFDNTLFEALKSHGLLPVTVGEAGRENPFESY